VRERGLRENSILALAGDGASKAGALVVIVVAARFFSVSEFAVLATGLAAAGLLGSILDLGAGQLLTRDGARDRATRGQLFSGLMRGRAPLAAVVFAGAVIVGVAIGRPLTALVVTALGLCGALTVSVLALYRSCQDIFPEAIQKLGAGLLSAAVTVLACLVAPSADILLAALALVTLVALVPLVRLAPRVADFGGGIAPSIALRRAAPIGLLVLATVAYYRSGTLALAGLAGSKDTAAFGVAASIAFGMLMLPNAITTALLPRLATESESRDLVACARLALIWTFVVATLVSAAAALVVPMGLPLVLGEEYRDAGVPFVVLCVGVPLIAASGVIGISLLSVGRLRPLGVQVAASLAVNLVVLAVLVPPFGATGAALATVACEAIGLVLLIHVGRRALPGLFALSPAPSRRMEASGAAIT
jgi:O-antigen/teichoic acid export membrane protein